MSAFVPYLSCMAYALTLTYAWLQRGCNELFFFIFYLWKSHVPTGIAKIVSMSEYTHTQHRLTRNSAKGKILNRKCNWPFWNIQLWNALLVINLQRCMWQNVQPWLHINSCAEIAIIFLPPFGWDISPLLWWGGGEAQKTLPSFSLPPSIALALALRRLALQHKMQNTSLNLHALGSFLRPGRVYPCTKRLYYCTICKTVRSWIILQLHCKEFSAPLTWWAKAGSWKLLTWISHSPCERTFFLLRTQGMPGLAVENAMCSIWYVHYCVLYLITMPL